MRYTTRKYFKKPISIRGATVYAVDIRTSHWISIKMETWEINVIQAGKTGESELTFQQTIASIRGIYFKNEHI